jgi:ribosome biogenesis GTPase
MPDAPDCAIMERVAEGELGDVGRTRLDSLQRLLGTLRA